MLLWHRRVASKRLPLAEKLTFLLFTTLPLVAYLDSANREDDSYDEEENAAHDPRGDRFMLHSGWHGELHLV